MLAEADLDRDRAVGQLTSVAPPAVGIFRLEHYARVDGPDSPTRDFASSAELDGHRGHHGHDDGVIHIEFPGNGVPPCVRVEPTIPCAGFCSTYLCS
jgi:hypothetical protein